MGTTIMGTGASGKPKKKKKKKKKKKRQEMSLPRILRKSSEVLVAVHFL
jgi:hypothetical protein